MSGVSALLHFIFSHFACARKIRTLRSGYEVNGPENGILGSGYEVNGHENGILGSGYQSAEK